MPNITTQCWLVQRGSYDGTTPIAVFASEYDARRYARKHTEAEGHTSDHIDAYHVTELPIYAAGYSPRQDAELQDKRAAAKAIERDYSRYY